MKNCLEVVDLGCLRGDRWLFRGLSQKINAGQLLHVAGSNGSGKTTLLRTLCGLTRADEGDVRWHGVSLRTLGDEYRQDVTYLGHKDGVHGELTPTENLRTFACLSGDRDGDGAQEALERFGLGAHRALPTKILSQGQRRRTALARLLMHRKPLWILDEPFTALDAPSCRLVSELLAEHLDRGGIAVLSSHQAFDLPASAIRRIDLDQLRSVTRGETGASTRRNSAESRSA